MQIPKIDERREDAGTVEKIADISGTNIFSCYQCGNCSGTCPAADYMDLKPHFVIRLLQLGQTREVLKSNTMWFCAACITCTVRCPKGVDIAAVMEALRQIVLRGKTDYVDLSSIDRDVRARLPQIALINNLRKTTL
jgi:heterodisulfide reductase subunit C